MQRHIRRFLAGAFAMLALAIATADASASLLSVNEQGFRIVWSSLTMSLGGAEISCEVTLTGSFHEAAATKSQDEKAQVTSASVESCSGGTATVLTETLPWSVHYQSYTGVLPRITGVDYALIGIAMSVDPEGALPACLFGTTEEHPLVGRATIDARSGVVTGFQADESVGIPLEGRFLCRIGGEIVFSGTAEFTTTTGETFRYTLTTPSTLSPSPVEFGDVEPESINRATVTITAVLEVAINSISVRTGANFSITDPNSCRRSRLVASARCSFTAIFEAPNTEGRSYEDTILVETSLGTIEDAVSGRTRDPIPPVASPSPVDFGRVEPEAFVRRSVTLTARSAVTLTSIRVRSGTYVAITDPNRCARATLEPSETCVFNVILEAPGEAGRSVEDTVLIANSIRQIEDAVTAET